MLIKLSYLHNGIYYSGVKTTLDLIRAPDNKSNTASNIAAKICQLTLHKLIVETSYLMSCQYIFIVRHHHCHQHHHNHDYNITVIMIYIYIYIIISSGICISLISIMAVVKNLITNRKYFITG